jgi:Na+-transporting NADH:ubiquinone oxidoreductase subunit NqrD
VDKICHNCPIARQWATLCIHFAITCKLSSSCCCCVASSGVTVSSHFYLVCKRIWRARKWLWGGGDSGRLKQ